jgi:DNA-binding NarL/FixJ family response regulator
MPIRLLIIDDHFAQRLGVMAAVNTCKDIAVAGQGSKVEQAVALYQELRPDVTLMDFSLPDGTGVEAIRRIRSLDPEARLLMLTVMDAEEVVFSAYEAGASGYLTKAASSKTLIAAIRALALGETYFPETAMAKIKARSERDPLSPRELEILNLIVEGLSNKEIGSRLNITPGTAKLHVGKVLAKMGATDRTRAAILAVERGIVRLA